LKSQTSSDLLIVIPLPVYLLPSDSSTAFEALAQFAATDASYLALQPKLASILKLVEKTGNTLQDVSVHSFPEATLILLGGVSTAKDGPYEL